MRDYNTPDGFNRAMRVLSALGASLSTTDLGAGKTRTDLNIPKTAIPSIKSWGFVDYCKSAGLHVVRS